MLEKEPNEKDCETAILVPRRYGIGQKIALFSIVWFLFLHRVIMMHSDNIQVKFSSRQQKQKKQQDHYQHRRTQQDKRPKRTRSQPPSHRRPL